MPRVDVNLIEQRLGLRLPPVYRQFLLTYPKRLRETKQDLTWNQEPISERQLFGDAGRIIDANIDVRRLGTPWIGEEGGRWPDQMLVVGDDWCGNYWCVDLATGGDAVWFYNHEIGGFESDSDSLAGYVERTILEVERFNRDQGIHGDSSTGPATA